MSSSAKRPGGEPVGYEPPTKVFVSGEQTNNGLQFQTDALNKSMGECSTDEGNKDDTSEEVGVELADKFSKKGTTCSD